MVAAVFNSSGRRVWAGETDDEGHRSYTVTHQVKTTSTDDGPAVVMQASGLPTVGSVWNFGNDVDIWAFCYPYMRVRARRDNEPCQIWDVEQKFSTKPLKRCQSSTIENPIMEPDRLSGTFVKYLAQARYDKDGNPITNSAKQFVQGKDAEFDANRPTVRVEQNVPNLQLDVFSNMIDSVNLSAMWGLPARCIKLSNVSWERKLWGVCNYYYTRSLDFDISYVTFDRSLPDRATKVLFGHWDDIPGTGTGGGQSGVGWVVDPIAGVAADPDNLTHYIHVKDRYGENIDVLLDGTGKPAETFAEVGTINVQYYAGANFLLLGVPLTL